MATRKFDYLSVQGTHEIGNLNSKWAKHLANGALATEAIENFTLVEEFFEDGVRKCKQLTDATKEGYLVTTTEVDQLMDGEELVDFYNGKDEMVRLTKLENPLHFETSAFSLNTGVTATAKGLVAHFDPATKKYIVSDSATAHADFATAANKFTVVDEDTDLGYAFDKPTIRLEVQ